jgi:toxin-antitoxin system PIN domain toxin
VIAVDTNILVYAHRADSDWHDRAAPRLRRLAESRAAWAIPWPCIHEFLAVVTHPRVYDPPTPTRDALAQVEAWLESPSLLLLGEGPDHWEAIRPLLEAGKVAGPRVHDARIAALCLAHGVHELWTADRDFGRFAALQAVNPLTQVAVS